MTLSVLQRRKILILSHLLLPFTWLAEKVVYDKGMIYNARIIRLDLYWYTTVKCQNHNTLYMEFVMKLSYRNNQMCRIIAMKNDGQHANDQSY